MTDPTYERDVQPVSWLGALLGRDDVTGEDLQDGFVLLQLLTLISPSSTDLEWYSSPSAMSLEPDELRRRTHDALASGARKAGINENVLPDSTLAEAKEGNLGACITVLEVLQALYEGRYNSGKAVSGTERSGDTRVRGGLVGVAESVLPDQTEEEDFVEGEYESTEASFKPAVRWLLNMVKHHANAPRYLGPGCIEEIDEMLYSFAQPRKLIPRGHVIPVLCSSRLYHVATHLIFPSSKPDSSPYYDSLLSVGTGVQSYKMKQKKPIKSTKSEPLDFLDVLTTNGYLNFKTSLRESVRDMVADRNPFYESIHSNILEALMAARTHEITVESVVAHLRCFPTFDAGRLYPYDVEDAMLIWINQCIADFRSSQSSSDLEDLEDLAKDTIDGRGFCLLFSSYFPSHMDIKRIVLSGKGCAKANICAPPWMPEELAAAGSGAALHAGSGGGGGFRMLIMSFMCDLFGVCKNIQPKRTYDSTVGNTRRVSKARLKEVQVATPHPSGNGIQTDPEIAKSQSGNEGRGIESAVAEVADSRSDKTETAVSRGSESAGAKEVLIEHEPVTRNSSLEEVHATFASVAINESTEPSMRKCGKKDETLEQLKEEVVAEQHPKKKKKTKKGTNKEAGNSGMRDVTPEVDVSQDGNTAHTKEIHAEAQPRPMTCQSAEKMVDEPQSRPEASRKDADSNLLLKSDESGQINNASSPRLNDSGTSLPRQISSPHLPKEADNTVQIASQHKVETKKRRKSGKSDALIPPSSTVPETSPPAACAVDTGKSKMKLRDRKPSMVTNSEHDDGNTNLSLPDTGITCSSAASHAENIEEHRSVHESQPKATGKRRKSKSNAVAMSEENAHSATPSEPQSAASKDTTHILENANKQSSRFPMITNTGLKPEQHQTYQPGQEIPSLPRISSAASGSLITVGQQGMNGAHVAGMDETRNRKHKGGGQLSRRMKEGSAGKEGLDLVDEEVSKVDFGDGDGFTDGQTEFHETDDGAEVEGHMRVYGDVNHQKMDDSSDFQGRIQVYGDATLFVPDDGEDDRLSMGHDAIFEGDAQSDGMAESVQEESDGVIVDPAHGMGEMECGRKDCDNLREQSCGEELKQAGGFEGVQNKADHSCVNNPKEPDNEQREFRDDEWQTEDESNDAHSRKTSRTHSARLRRYQRKQQKLTRFKIINLDAPTPISPGVLSASPFEQHPSTAQAAEEHMGNAIEGHLSSASQETQRQQRSTTFTPDRPVPSKSRPHSANQRRPGTGLMSFPLPEEDSDTHSDRPPTARLDYLSDSSDDDIVLTPQHHSAHVSVKKDEQSVKAKPSSHVETTEHPRGVAVVGSVQKPAERREELKAKKLQIIQRIEASREADRAAAAKQKEEAERIKAEQRRQQEEQCRQRLEERAKQRAEKKAREKEMATVTSERRRSSVESPLTTPKGNKPTTTPRPSPATAAKEQSNRQLIRNALVHVCLAGSVNEKVKQEVLEDLADSTSSHFLILFRDIENYTFRGLYSYDPTLNQALKVYAGTQGPDVLEASAITAYYKYDSGARTFRALPTRSLGRSVHAVAIERGWGDHYWM
ncbi:Calmodulin-regulated spectrin-associated protein 1 [Borealophlyctis nickersoniae]|nr:Calmodulin-regulated spectrin-associated protein 1 [Borealophlyctis nickersoniae]